MKTCPKCGVEALDKDLFCKFCGIKLVEPSMPPPIRRTSRKTELKKTCPSCGRENQHAAKFCSNCGSQLEVKSKPIEEPVYTPVSQSIQPSTSLFSQIGEAFVTLVKPTPPLTRPTDVVYKKLQPYGSISKYMIIGLFLFFVGLILSTSGLFLSAPLWFLASISIIPILYLAWIYRQDRWESEPHELVILSLGWGAFAAFIVMLLWETILARVDVPSWIGGPLPEEPIKILGIYWLATHKRLGKEFNNHLDGMVYGAAAGAGFAIAENFIYVLYLTGEGVPLMLAVLVRGTIGHVFYSALVGRWLGLAKVRKGYINLVDLIPGLLVAMTLHGLWNSPLFDPVLFFFDDIGGDYGFILGIFIIASPYYLILYKYVREALRDEKLWGYHIGHAPNAN